MPKEDNIKDYQQKELQWYILANVLVYICFKISFDFSQFFEVEKLEILLKIAVLLSTSAIISIFTFIADSLFSVDFKIFLLYFKFPFFKKYKFTKMSGETVFVDLAKSCSDIRFTNDDFNENYKDIINKIPSIPSANDCGADKYSFQNKEWYKIYSLHRCKKMILISNREFLLCRDMYIMTIVSLVIYSVFSLVFKDKNIFSIEYLMYLVSMLVIMNLSARRKAKRLVCNVIAVDLQNKQTEE